MECIGCQQDEMFVAHLPRSFQAALLHALYFHLCKHTGLSVELPRRWWQLLLLENHLVSSNVRELMRSRMCLEFWMLNFVLDEGFQWLRFH